METVVELSPTTRTRLIPIYEYPDLTHLYITLFLTVISCVITLLCLNEYGLEPTTTTVAAVCSSFLLLSLNAFYGLKAYKQLKYFRDIQYTEYVNRLNDVRAHDHAATNNMSSMDSNDIWRENVKSKNNFVLS
ncbi:unnamed protein product [Auanema sp. JU1783]|nr:unnamed protein product [Auanema sp. JU1783]